MRTGLKGISLLEVLVVVAVVSLLAGMVVVITDKLKQRAEKVVCINQMRTLHSSFVAYVEDVGHWPQLPEDLAGFDSNDFYQFWVKELDPYGASQVTWLCPTHKRKLAPQMRAAAAKPGGGELFYGSYAPTVFDKRANTPFRWNQPWIIERGDFHGSGAHMLMPDGSIRGTQEAFYGR